MKTRRNKKIRKSSVDEPLSVQEGKLEAERYLCPSCGLIVSRESGAPYYTRRCPKCEINLINL